MTNLGIISIGFTAMASQIVLMRELFGVFYGNELSIGFMLASWLLGGALGSLSLGRFADRTGGRETLLSFCQILTGVLLPLSVLTARLIKPALDINPGEVIGLFPTVAASFLVAAPVSIILAFMFSVASRISQAGSDAAASGIGRAYFLEAAGAIIGGAAASFVFARIFDNLEAMALLGTLNILSALLMAARSPKSGFRIFLMAAGIAVFAAASVSWPLNAWRKLSDSSLRRQWPHHELLSSRNSIYGNVTVTRRGGQTNFFDNGLYLYAVPDEQTAEESVHFALLECVRAPRRVLLIGGGVGGLLTEILKHPVENIDYVELDPLIVEMGRSWLPQPFRRSLDDPRVAIINEDGRHFIKRHGTRYDCVIIHLGDPYTAQLNRFYTAEFFREAKEAMNPGGIISFGLSSSESYINKELASFLGSIYATLKDVFKEVRIIPGETACFLASDTDGALTYDYKVLEERAVQRRLELKYAREYYLFPRLSPWNIAYTQDAVMAAAEGRVRKNLDFNPISYYYGMIFWTGRFRDSGFNRALKIVTEGRLIGAVLAVCGIIILSGLIGMKKKLFYRKAVLVAVTATGFSSMAVQIALLLAFQILYGYLYYKLGAILTSFMAGLAIGGWLAVKTMPRIKNEVAVFNLTQACVFAYPLMLTALFWWLGRSKSDALSWLGSNVLFLALPAAGGITAGFQFPLAAMIYLGESGMTGRASGVCYGLDLLGSCLGAALAGVFLVPVLGVFGSCFAVAGLNFAALVFLEVSGLL